MTGLIIALLLVALIIYAVFFAIFKVIWILLKKQTNKGPLLWAGVCTVLFTLTMACLLAWGTYKLTAPFHGIFKRTTQNKQPVYGQSIYTDVRYGFTLVLSDGMDLADWIHLDEASLKLGMDTNVFKEKKPDMPVSFLVLVRETEPDEEEPPFDEMREILDGAATQRDFRLTEQEEINIDGRPGYYLAGSFTEKTGRTIPVWVTMVQDGKQNLYVGGMYIGKGDPSSVKNTVRSLRFARPGKSIPPTGPEETLETPQMSY